jgi:hypothetical protein
VTGYQALASPRRVQHARPMARRFQVPLDALEAEAHVPDSEQVQEQASGNRPEPLVAGPQVHPYGDGATGPDGDGD